MNQVKLDLLIKAIDEKKGEEIETYDVSLTSPFCESIIVATVLNGRHGKAIADELAGVQEKLGETVRHIEGTETDHWILVDLNDVIVHLFTREERARVDVESVIKSVYIYE